MAVVIALGAFVVVKASTKSPAVTASRAITTAEFDSAQLGTGLEMLRARLGHPDDAKAMCTYYRQRGPGYESALTRFEFCFDQAGLLEAKHTF